MKVTCETLRDSQVLLQVEVEPERSARSLDDAYRRLANRVSIPGFRKGKAPRHIVERMIGREALVQESLDLLLPEVYREAMEQSGIQPVDKPQVDIVQEQPLVVKMTVSVWPAVDLGEYREVRVEPESVSIREEEVEAVLGDLREDHAEWLPVERAVAAGDRVTLDVIGRIRGVPILYNPSGEAILATETGEIVLDQKGAEYSVRPDSEAPVKGFGEQLVGLQPGAEKRFELTFPPDHPDRKLASKAVIFSVLLHDVKEKRLPALDDEFAKTVGSYDTLAGLRKNMRDALERRAGRDAERRLVDRVLDTLADRAHIELPPTLIEKEIDRVVERTERNLRQANLDLSAYLRATNKSQEELRATYRADAIANLRRYFVLEAVANAEKITVSPEEVDAEIAAMTEMLAGLGAKNAAQMKGPERRDEVAEELRHRKARERIVAIATGEAAEQPIESTGDGTGEASEAQ